MITSSSSNGSLLPATQCIHAGFSPEGLTGGAVTPIYPASANGTCPQTGTLLYPRYLNLPNHQVVAQKLCALETGADEAIITSSGMAAITTALYTFLKPGSHIILPGNVYGGTDAFVRHELPQFDIEVTFLKECSVEAYEAAIQANTRVLYLESPSNPLLQLQDLEAIALLAKQKGLVTIIDNTFATPINQTPLALGVDVVVHSATKALNGHSDLMAGAIVAKAVHIPALKTMALNRGGCLNAYDLFLLERGMKTLALRMERHNSNAMAVATFLEGHPAVKQVAYPGLASHPQHGLACTQMKGFGGMVTCLLHGGLPAAEQFVERLQLFLHAISLGGIESLVSLPAKASHAKMSEADRTASGMHEGLIRLSVGIEDEADLLADVAQALAGL